MSDEFPNIDPNELRRLADTYRQHSVKERATNTENSQRYSEAADALIAEALRREGLSDKESTRIIENGAHAMLELFCEGSIDEETGEPK